MLYDKNQGFNIEGIETHLAINLLYENNLIFVDFLKTTLPENVNYNFNLSFMKVVITNWEGVIFERLGNFDYVNENDNYIIREIFHGIDIIGLQPDNSVSVSGRIYITNNTFFSFNRNNISPRQFIPLYFNV